MQIQTKAASTLRTIAGGDIIGSIEPGGCHAWRGIRYAAPPVGNLRWRAPQAPAPWTGIAEALRHGAIAPQYAGLLLGVPTKQHGQIVGDEDCLNLNVFAPAWTPQQVPRGKARRSVMVWIHGGGLAAGASATYDVLRNYAEQDDIVVVTVNYRLGVLGWLTHPALREADGATPHECSGNFGLLDLIAALEWVRDNIGAFGGNPGNVTVFGESAGGQMVLALLASPLATGLFHRAIAQSPTSHSVSMAEAEEANEHQLDCERASSSEIIARLWAAYSGRADVDRPGRPPAGLSAQDTATFLRSLTPAQLLSAFKPGTAGIYLAPRVARDGVVLPLAPLPQLFTTGQWNRVPVIIGCNRDEYRTFIADKPEHARMLFGRLPILLNRSAYLTESAYLSTAWQAAHIDPVADAMLASGHRDIWSYRFDWDEAPRLPFVRPDLLLGAAHGMEMAFAFRDTKGELDIFGVNTPFNRGSRVALAKAMGDAWTSFAKTGSPVLDSGIRWERRGVAGPDSLLFDSRRDGGLRMAAIRTNMATLKQNLLATSDVASAELRCKIYARVFLWSPLFRGAGNQEEYLEWRQRFGCHTRAEDFRPAIDV